MTGPGDVFREIHRLRRHAKELGDKIEQAPRHLRTQQNLLARHEEKLNQAHETIKQLKVKMHEGEVTIRGLQTVIKKHEKQRDEAGNKKEYDALQLEIKNEKQNITRTEDEILEVMGQIEELTAQLPALEKTAEQARADFAKYQKDNEERLTRFAVERDRALEELGKVETGLPEDILPYYQREVRGRGQDALAAADHLTCSACYTEITSQMYNDLRQCVFVKCKSCGRILYLSEAN